MTRKGAGALLTILFVLFSIPLYARAADPPTVSVSDGSAAPGEDVALDVFISGNPGIYSFSFGFDYDETRLELKGVSADPALGGQSQFSRKFVWISGSEDSVYNGRILTLLFTVKTGAPAGSSPVNVTYSPGDICNFSEEIINPGIEPGTVTVTGGIVTDTDAAGPGSDENIADDPGDGTNGSGDGAPVLPDTVMYDPDMPEMPDISELCPRLAGSDRIRTAVAVSSEGWDSAVTVLLADAFNYPDALAGATLSKLYDAPILLTDSDSLDAAVLSELERLGAEKVVILGGASAVSETVENIIKSAGISVERLSGTNRNGTAAAIAKELNSGGGKAFLVSNANFADALSVSPIAACDGSPILYINPDGSIPIETAEVLKSGGCSQAYIIGGGAAIDTGAENVLKEMGIKTERISGDDRYMTSLAVCERFGQRFISGKAALATGKNFPDALSGAAFAAKYGMPVILIGDSVPDRLKDYISSRKLGSLYAFGGTGALSDDVISSLVPCLKLDRTSSAGENGGDDKTGLLSWLYSCGGNDTL